MGGGVREREREREREISILATPLAFRGSRSRWSSQPLWHVHDPCKTIGSELHTFRIIWTLSLSLIFSLLFLSLILFSFSFSFILDSLSSFLPLLFSHPSLSFSFFLLPHYQNLLKICDVVQDYICNIATCEREEKVYLVGERKEWKRERARGGRGVLYGPLAVTQLNPPLF